MNETEKTILLSTLIVAAAILGGAQIIASRVGRSLDEKNLWAGSNIPQIASDVQKVTGAVSGIFDGWKVA